jgi:AAA15 family ATPase/GTPase
MFDEYKYLLSNDLNNPKKWKNESIDVVGKASGDILASVLFEKDENDRMKILNQLLHGHEQYVNFYNELSNNIKGYAGKKGKEQESSDFFKFIFNKFLKDRYSNEVISNFIVYSPEQSSLRKFEETNQIYPLGIRGEGLFQYLKELSLDKKNKKLLNEIKHNLILIDWYENFDLPENLMSNEYVLKIKDRYLYPSLQHFDQRSTNEGFLFLLFYSTLFISKVTPTFFAIDNIDASLNPKLCIKLTKNIAALAKKNKKQVIVTTQNPAILDGLNLKDNSQRLFVVRRNDEGHTKAKRIEYKMDRKMKLSELWTNGYIGGLPENF